MEAKIEACSKNYMNEKIIMICTEDKFYVYCHLYH